VLKSQNISKIQNFLKKELASRYAYFYDEDKFKKGLKEICGEDTDKVIKELLKKKLVKCRKRYNMEGIKVNTYSKGDKLSKFLKIPKVNSKTKYFMGIPQVSIKNILRKIRSYTPLEDKLPEFIEEQSHLNLEESKELTSKLYSEGYICLCEERHYVGKHITLTEKGISLSLKRIGNPISKNKALEVIELVKEKINKINNDLIYQYTISFVGIHGSFSKGEKDTFGDVDFMYRLIPKEFDVHKQMKNEQDFTDEYGSYHLNFYQRLGYARTHIESLLKKGSSFIDAQPYDEEIFNNTKKPIILYHDNKLENAHKKYNDKVMKEIEKKEYRL